MINSNSVNFTVMTARSCAAPLAVSASIFTT
jgi:hypothetical protein